MGSRPRMVVFDLDFTLWPFWVDGSGFTHVRAPFHKDRGRVFDSWGKMIPVSDEIYEIMKHLKNEDYKIGIASATRQIDGAQGLIRLLGWDEFVDYKQIYPGSKLKHFARLREMSGCEYDEMIFFDDDIRFVEEVRSLGVFCVHVQDCVNSRIMREGLAAYGRQYYSTVKDYKIMFGLHPSALIFVNFCRYSETQDLNWCSYGKYVNFTKFIYD